MSRETISTLNLIQGTIVPLMVTCLHLASLALGPHSSHCYQWALLCKGPPLSVPACEDTCPSPFGAAGSRRSAFLTGQEAGVLSL